MSRFSAQSARSEFRVVAARRTTNAHQPDTGWVVASGMNLKRSRPRVRARQRFSCRRPIPRIDPWPLPERPGTRPGPCDPPESAVPRRWFRQARGHVLAQDHRVFAGFPQHCCGAVHRLQGQLGRQAAWQPQTDACLDHGLDGEEDVGRSGSRDGRDRVPLPLGHLDDLADAAHQPHGHCHVLGLAV